MGSRGDPRGTDAANHLVGVGRASVRVLGHAGPDRIRVGFNNARAPLQLRERTALGGSGRDVLFGSSRQDGLIGGRGRDIANGRGGKDFCLAEALRSCELP